MPFTPITWTDDMVAELKRLWPTGMSCEKIGKKLGMSKNAVVGKSKRLNLPQRRLGTPRAKANTGPKIIPPQPKPDIPAPKPLLEVGQWFKTGQCKYIFGDPAKEYRYCGYPVSAGKNYCEYHAALCNVPNTIGKVRL